MGNELRREVLLLKAQTEGLNLSDEIIDYIAENVTNSIREIEGVMLSIVTHAAILNVDITIDLARNVINNAIRMNASSNPQINFEMVTQSVSTYYNIDPDAIYTKNRKREISDARQMVMFLAKKHIKMQSVTIGTRLARSHSTVLYAIKQIEERLPFEKQLQEDVAAIEKLINSPQK